MKSTDKIILLLVNLLTRAQRGQLGRLFDKKYSIKIIVPKSLL
jgi:hypothetical protein